VSRLRVGERVQSSHGKNFTDRAAKIEIPQDEKASRGKGFDAQSTSRKKAGINLKGAGIPGAFDK
jgi:hypothetical protein